MALSHIYNAGYTGGRDLSVENVTEIKRGTIAKLSGTIFVASGVFCSQIFVGILSEPTTTPVSQQCLSGQSPVPSNLTTPASGI